MVDDPPRFRLQVISQLRFYASQRGSDNSGIGSDGTRRPTIDKRERMVMILANNNGHVFV